MARIRNATDLGVNMDRFEAPRSDDSWIWLGGLRPWEMHEHAAAYLGLEPCPVCEGGTLRRKSYCLGCDATGLDGVADFPGADIDAYPDPDWAAQREAEKEAKRLSHGIRRRKAG